MLWEQLSMKLTNQPLNLSVADADHLFCSVCALLVADEDKSISDANTDQIERDIDQLQLIVEAERHFEHRRRNYADHFDSGSDDDDEEMHADQKIIYSASSNSDSDAPTSTDSDSPYGSDSESSSSYDEYYAQRQLPKKKIHGHHKGPIKSYFQERIGNWPKYRYKKYKRHHMKKHGIRITYGNIHTKEIKHSLKVLRRERKKDGSQLHNVTNMMEHLVKQSNYLSLDAEHPMVPGENTSNDVEPSAMHSKSRLKKMKDKLKKPFKHKEKASTASNTDNEQVARSTDGDETRKSSNSLEKI